MKLRNFDLEEPRNGIAVEGCGCYWDLHNFADLVDVKYLTVENTVEFRFVVGQEQNPWGDEQNHSSGLVLRFTEVRFLQILQSDSYTTNEDDCVCSISKVSLNPQTPPERRAKEKWDESEDFGLLFELQSGRTIEVHAAAAEMIPS